MSDIPKDTGKRERKLGYAIKGVAKAKAKSAGEFGLLQALAKAAIRESECEFSNEQIQASLYTAILNALNFAYREGYGDGQEDANTQSPAK
jgi:hypothetical protein